MDFESFVYGQEPLSPILPDSEITSFFWEKEGYSRPKVKFCFYGVEGKGLYARFAAEEQNILARYTQRDEPCWCDSCCELFIAPVEGDGRYINIEMNPNGAYLSQFGAVREGRVFVKELTSLAPVVEAWREGCSWGVSVFVPDELIRVLYGKADYSTKPGTVMRGNFYKCADDSVSPHYGAYFPVDDAALGFHNPAKFGKIIMRGKENEY